jgi:hypothetical protein
MVIPKQSALSMRVGVAKNLKMRLRLAFCTKAIFKVFLVAVIGENLSYT